MADHQPPPRQTTAQGGKTVALPQGTEDQIAQGGPVARPRKATGTRPAQQRLFRGAAGKDLVQNGDGGADAGGGRHDVARPKRV